jgi:D-alanyl-D-alanine carboxypeptidase/D-alanyl-D-alanine-endopeptidase (penicillin-binding protein 4)
MNADRRRLTGLALFLLPLVAAGCVTPQLGHDPALSARLDEILYRLSDTGATVTARVLELPSSRELYARDIDVPFTPASNMKIPVSAAGLDMFGADRTFQTYLALDSDDLWVIGTGDPGIGDPRLAKRRGSTPVGVFDEWADALYERRIDRIAGDLYYYDGALEDQWLHPSWGEDVLHWYGAPVSGLNFNDNCVDITVFPTKDGQPVRYEVMPPVRNITVVNECITGGEHEPTIEKLPEGDIYKLGGTCTTRVELKSKPVGNSGAFFCDALRTHLASRGIVIAGEVKRAESPLDGCIPPADDRIVAVHETTVRDIIGRINTNSQNFFAEALCKLTGQAYAARHGRQVPGSWADGDTAIRAFLRRCNIDDRHLAVADGSGLSDDNKLTSRLLTDLFAVMFSRPDGAVFIDSLAKGGLNGSLEKRFEGLEGRVFAKTGYIEGVRALSGYVRTRAAKHQGPRADSGSLDLSNSMHADKWLTFSIIYNNIPGSVKPYEALQDEAVRLLVHWPNIEELPTSQPAQPQETRADAELCAEPRRSLLPERAHDLRGFGAG